MLTKKNLIAIILMLLVSSTFNQYIIDTKKWILLNNKLKDIIDLTLLCAIFIIGYFCFDKNTPVWIKKLWNYIYILSIMLIIFMLLIDWFIIHYSYKDGQFRFGTLKQLLVSPIVYFLFIYFSRRYSKL